VARSGSVGTLAQPETTAIAMAADRTLTDSSDSLDRAEFTRFAPSVNAALQSAVTA
jgi:hypothetical protein